MTQTVSDFIVERLKTWGIGRVYGYSGDGINGMMAALRRAEPDIRMVKPQHEEIGAFMASAHAKFTGQVGVCISTSGPGAVHLLNGLYDAKKDHMPVLAIVGQQSRASLGTDYQQEIDLTSLFKDVAGHYVHMVSDPVQARHLIDQAIRIALARRTVTAIVVPNDVQDLEMEMPSASHGAVYSGVGYRKPAWLPASNDLDEAAAILDEGQKVAILAGAGCKHAVDEVMALADKIGAGVAKALLAKVIVPDDRDFVTGTMGLLGTQPSQMLMDNCDTLLMVGTRFPYAEFLPPEGQARAIQIDIDAEALGLRYPTEVNLHGDAAAIVQALIERVSLKEDRSWQEKIIEETRDWWALLGKRAQTSASPINPQYVFWSLNQQLPDNVMLACDVGSATNWYARYLKIGSDMMGSVSGGLASMGNGVPYILSAKFAYPDRPGVAMVGDGAMQMLGNQALIGISQYWQEWEDPRCIVLVLNNQDLNQVSWEQRIMEGDPKYETSQDLPDFAYDQYAEMLGLKGLRMAQPEDVDRVWEEALNADRPVVINAYVDPEIGPLPPHINFDQAKGFIASMIKGDPSAYRMMKQSLKQLAAKH